MSEVKKLQTVWSISSTVYKYNVATNTCNLGQVRRHSLFHELQLWFAVGSREDLVKFTTQARHLLACLLLFSHSIC